MQWWCAATGLPWTWQWRPYPGVWLFVIAVALGFPLLRHVARHHGDVVSARGRPGLYALGVLALWAALDWPIGALGGGYLALAHMVQFLLIAYIAAPLLLLGTPRAAYDRLSWSRAGGAVHALTHPLLTLIAFNLIVAVTHLPAPTDALMATQLGSFVVDSVWLLAGMIFWWPICAPAPDRGWLQPPVQVGYLAAQVIAGTPLFFYLAFPEFPLYAVYELAPRVHGIDAHADQMIAGLIMKTVGMGILLVASAIVFLRWALREDRAQAAAQRLLASEPR